MCEGQVLAPGGCCEVFDDLSIGRETDELSHTAEPLIPDLWRQLLRALSLSDLESVSTTSRLFLEEYTDRLGKLTAEYSELAVQLWGEARLNSLVNILLDCVEGNLSPDLLPDDMYRTDVAAVIAADGSVRQDSKSSARWYRCFKKGPTAMVAHCEEGSAPGEISIQVSSAEAQLDVFKFGKHGTTSMIGYVYDVRSVPALVGLLICLLRGTSGTWPAAIAVVFCRPMPNRARLTHADLEALFSPLLSALKSAASCTVRVTWGPGVTLHGVKRVQWFRAARPFPARDLGLVLRAGPCLDKVAADAARPAVVPALEVDCCLLE